jgi:hypothetical protein
MSMWPVASEHPLPGTGIIASAQLVPDSGIEFDRLELVREGK